MTTIEVFHRGALISGFSAKGHTGYAEEGEDIVCAAVSALAELLATEIAEDKDAFASLESGDALISWSGHNAVWHALHKTFSRFADDFSKNLSYTEGIWWAK